MSAHATLLADHANDWLTLAVDNILLEYPHMPWIMASSPESYRLHRNAHPTFFGSFDWHSCVEMYWVAAVILRRHPDAESAPRAIEVIDSLLTPENIATETTFIQLNPGFERPYGWGWLLTFLAELDASDDPRAAVWSATLTPLADAIMDNLAAWLPRMTYPQRIGMHANTAFGLYLSWDALAARRPDLLETVRNRARQWFGHDIDYPFHYEPSGADFLSAGLCEAVLMQRVLGPDAFSGWLDDFFPTLVAQKPDVLFNPATVSDASDGQIAHLHGLNMSRAWAFSTLATAFPEGDPRAIACLAAARHHADAALPIVAGSDYMVEHWLVAYALLYASVQKHSS